MRFPFQKIKTYTTKKSKEEVMNFVAELLGRKTKSLFVETNDYVGSIGDSSFKFYENFNWRYSRANPKIKGTFISEKPPILTIKFYPHYIRVIFFLLFPCFVIPFAIFIDEMTINGILREPTIPERIFIVLIAGGGPTLWCYLDSVYPIIKAESWIVEQLDLTELPFPNSTDTTGNNRHEHRA